MKHLLSEKLPFFLLSAVFGVLAFFAQRAGGAVGAAPHLGAVSRLGGALIGYLDYVEKIFWPRNLSFLYLRPTGVTLGLLVAAVFVLAGISVLAAVNLRRRPYLTMGWLWFLGMLLPVSGVISFGLQSIADRYTYLASIGFFIMCTWGAAELAPITLPKPARGFLLVTGVAAILLVEAWLSRHQLAYWENTQTLMEHALKIDPDNYVAHDNLGIYFSRLGRTGDALRQYQLGRELDPAIAHRSAEAGRTNSTPPPDVPR